MELFAKQKWALNRSDSRINLWHGSVRSGKTVNVDFRFIQSLRDSTENLPSDVIDIMIGKTMGSLKRNVINPICGLLGNEAKYFSGKQELHIWDHIIHLVGANDERSVGKIQGSTIRKALGDEVTLWPESFFKMLDSRLSMDDSQFFGTTNPGPPNHYLKTDYMNRYKELNLKSFHFVLEDNTTLSKRFIQEIKKSYTGLWYRRYILGLWCVAEGAVFDFFDEDEHTIIKHPPAQYYILAIDYGTSNPFGALLMGVNHNTKPKIWAENELYFDSKKMQYQKTDGEYSLDLKNFCKGYLGQYWQNKILKTYVDPSAASFKLQLERDGFLGVEDADNSVMDGLRTKATMLKNGNYAICTRCINYIKEIYGYRWDVKAQERGLDQPMKTGDHLCDAGRYGVHSEFNGEEVDMVSLTVK